MKKRYDELDKPKVRQEELTSNVKPGEYDGIRFMPMGLMPTPDTEDKEKETDGE